MRRRTVAVMAAALVSVGCGAPAPSITNAPPQITSSPPATTVSSGASSRQPTGESRPTPVEGSYLPIVVEESGFTPVSTEGSDFASYAAVLTNPNTEWAAYRMLVLTSFLDDEQAYLAGDDLAVTVLPGQTTAIAGETFGAGSAVTFEVVPPDDPTPYTPFSSSGTIEVADIQSTSSEFGRVSTGTLISTLTSDQSFVQVFAVYRDAAGDIIGGASAGVESVPSGGTVTFEILDVHAPPGIAATEVYWQLGGRLP